nr:disease resistance protein (TIR-NBS-LRR class) family [Tanacetum cinerariifolium]
LTEHTAFPVFYDVEPTQVRKQDGPVGKAFSKPSELEAAGKWRDAMEELAGLAGWDLKATANGINAFPKENPLQGYRELSGEVVSYAAGLPLTVKVLGSFLCEFPKDLGQLECLEGLCLYSMKIKQLPDSICMLKHLKFLNLSLCALLEKLPEDIGRLGCLKELDITGTRISHLPQSIFGLKGLKIAAPQALLQLYDFPSEMTTTTKPLW